MTLTFDFYCCFAFGRKMLEGLNSLSHQQSWLCPHGGVIVFVPLMRRQRLLPNICTIPLVHVHVDMKRERMFLYKFLPIELLVLLVSLTFALKRVIIISVQPVDFKAIFLHNWLV